MTDQIEPHDLLYFSIKHSIADFFRPAIWNPSLGVGKHAQIVEVELQREYEGKGQIALITLILINSPLHLSLAMILGE